MYRLPSNTINLGQPVNRSAPLNRGLRGWWMAFPSRSGNRVLDLCGANHGTFINSPTISGMRPGGLGLSFVGNGSSSYLDVGLVPYYDGATAATFCCWLFRSATGVQNCFGRLSSTGNNRLAVHWSTSNFIFAQCAQLGGGPNAYAYISSTATGWFHIGMVFDGSLSGNTNRSRLYVNGIKQATTGGGGTIGTSTPTDATKWAFGNFDGGFGVGNYDDGRNYDRALSEDEMWQLYNASRTGYRNELNWLRRPIAMEAAAAAGTKLFRPGALAGLGSGGSFFQDPLAY